MNFGRTLKKTLKHNDLSTDFATWSAIARGRPSAYMATALQQLLRRLRLRHSITA
jgi:hypothetical protein